MREQFVRDLLRKYERKRDRNIGKKEKRVQEVYKKLPEVRKIDNQIMEIGLDLSRALLQEEDNPHLILEKLKNKLESLKQERAILLTENNIPLDYTDQQFDCNHCKDTGFLPGGEKCNCFKQQLINHTYSMSNMSNILERENFQTFNINLFSNEPFEDQEKTPMENMLHILSICESFVANFNNRGEENLLFYGPTGSGKTFLINCIAKALLDKGNVVIYQTAFKLLEILEDIRFHNADNRDRVHLIFDADLLIIDDLGTEMTNTFTNSELFNIINSRLLSGKKTIISTNFSPKDIMDTYDDRIFSRIFSKYTMLKFYGKDLRWE